MNGSKTLKGIIMAELVARKCEAIKSLARYLGKDYGVEVVYDPLGRCQTNGKKIYVPIMTDEAYADYEDFLVGAIFHETGHIAHTDIELYQETRDPIENTFLNVFEDYRVESFQMKDYHSGKYEIDNLHEFVKEKNKKKFKDPKFFSMLEEDPGGILWATSAAVFFKLSDKDYSYFPSKIKEFVEYTDDILREFRNEKLIRNKTNGTKMSKKYALKVVERLKDYLENPPSPPNQKEEEGDEGENEDGNESNGKKTMISKSKESSEKSRKGKKDKKKRSKKVKEILTEIRKSGPKEVYENVKEEIEEFILTSVKKDINSHIPHPHVLEQDSVVIPPIKVGTSSDKVYNLIKDKVQNEIDSMKSRILSLLMAQKRIHFLPDSDCGEIDIASLYSLRSGNERIFERREPGKRLNTAIEILIDCSGSMGWDNKYIGAREAAIACGETLEVLKVPFEITGYTTDAYGCSSYPFTSNDFEIYNRFEPTIHFIFKDFNENYDSVKHRMLAIDSNQNNADPDSVWWAACRLSRRREQRKILIVMSDGLPAMSYNCDRNILCMELKKVVKKIMNHGIEVYGIGVHTDEPKRFYPNFREIKMNTHNIAEAVYNCLAERLMSGT